MQALRTSVEINSRTSMAISVLPSNTGMSERRTRVIQEHDLVSRMRRACVQKRMTGLRMSGVFSTKDLIELGAVLGRSALVASIGTVPLQTYVSKKILENSLAFAGSKRPTTTMTEVNVNCLKMLSSLISSARLSSSEAVSNR